MRFRLLVPILLVASGAHAADINVATRAELLAALATSQPGDRILLASGSAYGGGFFRTGLTGVTITSQNPLNPAILDASVNGAGTVMQLTTARDVTITNVIFQNWTTNGLNIDDGGNWPTGKSQNITLRDVVVRNVTAPAGNNDGIKISGVDNYLFDRVQVTNWGRNGSAIDSVGTHSGVVQNSRFIHPTHSGGTALQFKGGSADIQLLSNFVQVWAGRVFGVGGITDTSLFRFPTGESGYEATRIGVGGNISVGGDSSANWIGSDGGDYAYNFINTPNTWIMRLLKENTSPGMTNTKNGVFRDNVVVYNPTISRISNVGVGTDPATFTIEGNQWYRAGGGPTQSQVQSELPTTEIGGIYGVNPGLDPNSPITFSTDWGLWAVNPHLAAGSVTVPDFANYSRAIPGVGATFDPLAANPFIGSWTYAPLTEATLPLDALSNVPLVPVPEPAGLAMVAAGASAWLWVRRSIRRGR